MPKGKESSNRHCSLCSDFQPLNHTCHTSQGPTQNPQHLSPSTLAEVASIAFVETETETERTREETWRNLVKREDLSWHVLRWGDGWSPGGWLFNVEMSVAQEMVYMWCQVCCCEKIRSQDYLLFCLSCLRTAQEGLQDNIFPSNPGTHL